MTKTHEELTAYLEKQAQRFHKELKKDHVFFLFIAGTKKGEPFNFVSNLNIDDWSDMLDDCVESYHENPNNEPPAHEIN